MAKSSTVRAFVALGIVGYCGYLYLAHRTLEFGAAATEDAPRTYAQTSSGSGQTAGAPKTGVGETTGVPKNSDVATKPRREIIDVTATQLFRAYEANEVATDEELKGKDVRVTGRVASINKDIWGIIYVSLRTPNQFMSANMSLSNADKEAAAKLRPGDTISVVCKSMKRWVGAPSGGDCRLQPSKP